MGWDDVKAGRNELFKKVLDELSPEERDILLELLRLETEQRGLTVPRIKAPFRDVVEGKIPVILRKLVVNNFRQLYGQNTIEFAPPGDRNVTAILGENGAGKTTLLNAFLWCLYGRVDLKNEESVLSFKALQDASIGQELQVEVSLVFEMDDAVYSVNRSGTFQKADGGQTRPVRAIELRIDKVGKRDGTTSKVPDPKQFIREALPEGLSKFFFFRGEDMEALASSDARAVDRLKEGVESFLDIELLDRARKHADDLRKDFERELTSLSQGDLKELGAQVELVEAAIDDLTERLAIARTDVLNHEGRKLEVEKRLTEVEETRPYLEKKAILEVQLKEFLRVETERRKAVASIVSKDGYLWLAPDVLRVPLELADAAAKRGELPAKIKPAFVDDRIAIGECICGRAIDAGAKATLTEWKRNKGLAGLDEEITTLRSQLRDLDSRGDAAWQELEEARTGVARSSQEIRQTVEQLSEVESELKGKDFKLDYVRDLQKQLNTITDQIVTSRVEVSRLNDQIDSRTVERNDLVRQRTEKVKGQEKVERLDRRARATGSIAAALDRMRKGWVEIVQKYLDGKLKESWNKVAVLDRLVEFTPEFKLIMKEVGGHGEWTLAAPSQANQRALALAFVASLVTLAGDIAEGESASKRPVFKGGRYPLVMDAPFATMDQYFKETLPKGLQETVPQLTLISNFEQWEGEVAARLFANVGRRYVLELHCDTDDRSIDFLGDRAAYVVREANCVRDWTALKEIQKS